MRAFPWGGVALTILTAAIPGRADEVRAKGEAAIRAWEAGRSEDAIELFHDAIAVIQGSSVEGLARALPDRVGTWTGGEVRTASGSRGSGAESVQWISAEREYASSDGGARVAVTLSTSPRIVDGQRAMLATFRNPQAVAMMNTVPGKRVDLVEEAGFSGWIVVETGKTAQMTAVGEQLMVSIDVPGGDAAALAAFRDAIPLGGLVRLDGR